ncbi:MAG: hypothetical protein ABI840_01630 [bacterium]
MTIKNILAVSVLLFSVLFLSGNLYSQQNTKQKKTPEELATKMTDRMKQNLSLTDEQYKQVYSLMLTKAQDRSNNKEKYKSMDKETRKEMKKQNMEDFKKQLSGILTPEQIQKMQQNKSKHKKHKGVKKSKQETGQE